MSHVTYQLSKDDEIIMETQAVDAERAIDYFYLDYPEMFTEDGFSVKIKKKEKERV
jgi:hypothetical protein